MHLTRTLTTLTTLWLSAAGYTRQEVVVVGPKGVGDGLHSLVVALPESLHDKSANIDQKGESNAQQIGYIVIRSYMVKSAIQS